MFETTWQIRCATGRCVDRKNGILKPLSFTKICTNLAHFDIPALITLHTYNLSVCDNVNMYTEAEAAQQTSFDETRT